MPRVIWVYFRVRQSQVYCVIRMETQTPIREAMGHSDISVTMNTYTHLGLEDAVAETNRVQQLESARKEQAALEGRTDEVRISKKMFRVG